MELEKIKKFCLAGQEIEDLISNSYVISFESSGEVKFQGHFNRILVEKYRDKANFFIGPASFVNGQLEIDGLQIDLCFD